MSVIVSDMITWVTGTTFYVTVTMWWTTNMSMFLCDLDWFVNVSMWLGLVYQCFYVTWTGLSMFLSDLDWFINVSMWHPQKGSIHNKEFNALNISYWHCNSQCFFLHYWTMFHVAVFIIWYVTIIALLMWHTHLYQILQPTFSLWSC